MTTCPAPKVATMADLESTCRAIAQTNTDLAVKLADFQEELNALRRKHAPGVKAAQRQANTLWATLRTEVARMPASEFAKPRTRIFHGIKVGLQLSKKQLQLKHDDEETIRLLVEHFPQRVQELTTTTTALIRDALKSLQDAELALIGGSWRKQTDQVVATPVIDELKRLADALGVATSGLTEEQAP